MTEVITFDCAVQVSYGFELSAVGNQLECGTFYQKMDDRPCM